MAKRRRFSADFKARVALEALVGDKTLAELASKHDIHPNMITQWKRQAKEGMPEIFTGKRSREDSARESEIEALQRKVGQLAVENDFLSKAFGR